MVQFGRGIRNKSETVAFKATVGSNVLHTGAVLTNMSLIPNVALSTKNEQSHKYQVITYIDGFNLYFGIRQAAINRGSTDTVRTMRRALLIRSASVLPGTCGAGSGFIPFPIPSQASYSALSDSLCFKMA